MNYFEVTFNSHAKFDQMKSDKDPSWKDQTVTLHCQDDLEEGKEIIFNLPTPEDYNYEMAQFSISKKEAELMVQVLKFHFGI